MIPKEKANNLYELMFYKLNDSKGIFMDVDLKDECAKQCALIAVNEILETTKVKWATQRKLPNGEYRFWKGVAYKKYWQEVKQEIEAL